MVTGLERKVCEGPLCAGIRTHLVVQFSPSGVCYACAAKLKAETDGVKGAAAPGEEEQVKSTKVCRGCGAEKPRAEFGKWKQQCLDCEAGKSTKVIQEAARPVKRAKPMKKTALLLSVPPIPAAAVAVSPVKNGLLLAHGSRLLSIALLGPREHDSEFIRALCAGLLQDSLTEAGCKDLVELAAEEA